MSSLVPTLKNSYFKLLYLFVYKIEKIRNVKFSVFLKISDKKFQIDR